MVEINNITKAKIDTVLIKAVAEKFLKYYKKNDYSVSIAFISDREMRRLNKKYRGMDKSTDVLSFAGEGEFLGEILVSYNQIKKQAKEQKKKIKDELVFIIIHGLLHLLGYDDESEEGAEKMLQLGEEFIQKLK